MVILGLATNATRVIFGAISFSIDSHFQTMCEQASKNDPSIAMKINGLGCRSAPGPHADSHRSVAGQMPALSG